MPSRRIGQGREARWPRVWITGASSGIGAALALALAAEGSIVAASARSQDALARLSQKATNLRGLIIPFPVDVTDAAAMGQTARRIEDRLGGIDLAILNAGTYRRNHAGEVSAESFRLQFDVNVMGVVNGLEPVLRSFRARGAGHAAVVASLSAYCGLPHAAAYGASKAALVNMCEALRAELAGSGVLISVINPGFVKTPLTDKNDFPMPFLMAVDDAARLILKGLKQERFEIAFPKRLAWLLKLVRLLPYGIYFRITQRLVRP